MTSEDVFELEDENYELFDTDLVSQLFKVFLVP